MTTTHKTTKDLIWLLPLFALWQLLHLNFLHPQYWFTFPEELHRGTIGLEILKGLKGSLLGYAPDDYAGGSLVVGGLASVFFRFFGSTLFALKLVPLTLFGAGLLFWHTALARSLGRKVACYFSLMFVFAPPMITRFQQSHMGDHPETILFTGITLFLLFNIVFHKKDSWKQYALLGFIAGFGTWFAYIFAITLLAAFFFVLDAKPRAIFNRKFFIFFAFSILGFSPWILRVILADLSAFEVHGAPLISYFDLGRLLESIKDYRISVPYKLLSSLTPAEFGWPVRKVIHDIYAGFFLIPLALYGVLFVKRLGLSKEDKLSLSEPIHFFFIYTVFFILICELSSFRNLRFWIPMTPFLFTLLAYVIDKLETLLPRLRRTFSIIFIGGFILTGIVSNVLMFSPAHRGKINQAKGYHYSYLANYVEFSRLSLCGTIESCFTHYPAFKHRLSPEDFHLLSTAIAVRIWEHFDFEAPEATLEALPPEIPHSFYSYLSYYLGVGAMNHTESLEEALSLAERLTVREAVSRREVLLGILDTYGEVVNPSLTPPSVDEAIIGTSQAFLNAHYWRSEGQRRGRAVLNQTTDLKEIYNLIETDLDQIPNAKHEVYLQGIGKAFLQQRIENASLKPSISFREMNKLPAAWKPSLFRGIGMMTESAECMESVPWIVHEIAPEIPEIARGWTDEGKSLAASRLLRG